MQVESISIDKHSKKNVYDILIVEDDPIQTIILKKLFLRYKLYNVIFRDSIRSASDYLDENSVHAIVSDYNLEDGKGSDLIEYDPEVPIIIMTATKDIGLVVELMKNDEVYDFVLKDYEKNFIELLHSTLEKAIKKFQLTKRLNQQKAQFKQLVENINDVICRTDGDGKILYSNQQVHILTGYNALEIFGEKFSFWVDKDYREEVENFYESQLASKREHCDYEFPIITKTGKTRWVGQTARISLDSQGKFLGYLFVIRDITIKKEA
ncbi:MAG: PAS domain S-box protein, partial [Cyclobacteriaceae bacterium]